MGQGLFNLIHQHQAKIARAEPVQGGVNGQELAVDVFHMGGAAGLSQSLTQQLKHFAIGSPTLAGVLEQEDVVEGALPRMAVCSRMSSSRRSPAPLMTTERRLAGMPSTAETSARMASGL